MSPNFEILFLIAAVIVAFVIGGAVVYIFNRKRILNNSAEDLRLELESVKVRLETELNNALKTIETKNLEISTKDEQITSSSQQLNQTLTSLEVSADRLRSVSAENDRLNDRNAKLEGDFSTLQSEEANARAQLKSLAEKLENIQLDNNLKEAENHELRRSNMSLTSERATLTANLLSIEEKLATQKDEIEAIRQKSHLEFESIANRILETKSEKFTASNRENIENILRPLKTDIDRFKIKVEETYDKESKERFSLESQVKALIEQTGRISNEANNLATALKGQAKAQGIWGEMILERILEMNGLVRGREFEVQHSVKNENGDQQFLDVMINLPDNRKLIIDSKVTLVAYDRYCGAETEEDRAKSLREHLQALNTHIDQLSRKKYEELPDSPDFVMLFVPIEPALLTAIQADTTLLARAYEKKILLISATTLMAAMKLVSDLWKRDNQSRNALEIAKQGEKLYEKFVGFVGNLEGIGKSIRDTQTVYEKAMGQLKHGRGNLVGQAEKLRKLGVKTTKSLPIGLLNYDGEEDVEDDLNPLLLKSATETISDSWEEEKIE